MLDDSKRKFINWLAGKPKGTPVDQQLAWDAAHNLVEGWSVGWKEPDAEQPDRVRLLQTAFDSEGWVHLMAIMRHVGPIKAFTEVGADEEMAANIVSVGTASKFLQTK